MSLRTRAAIAVTLGTVLLAFVVPAWWEFFSGSDRADGHTVVGFLLPVTAVFGVPGLLMLVLGVLVLRKEKRD